ncbi:MAG: hypothetical protein BJ554DRAFT_854 [Olpidium bornovanus]|uniref:Uncharacterized protein n=1 Tax=Olpidium bornovanus TaxID=278681 RepID=A0A8H7ZT20_9FUNG|nr:MAG: hypothetical protein BJ554DRAFT_854 [Olpidium bornovanus]
MRGRLGELAQSFLTASDWKDWKKVKVSAAPFDICCSTFCAICLTATQADNLAFLVGQELACAKSPIAVVNNYVFTVIPAFFERNTGLLNTHPLLTKETFTVFFKALNLELINILNTLPLSEVIDRSSTPKRRQEHEPPENAEQSDAALAAIKRVEAIVKCWQQLVAVAKSDDRRQILALILRHGRQFIDAFTVCGHSKVSKDLALTANVPQVRKSLETLLFRVKAMLDSNNCLHAFSIGMEAHDNIRENIVHPLTLECCAAGNLKHRNIAGEEVSSQVPREADTSDEGEVDEIVQYDYEEDEERRQNSLVRVTEGRAIPPPGAEEDAVGNASHAHGRESPSVEVGATEGHLLMGANHRRSENGNQTRRRAGTAAGEVVLGRATSEDDTGSSVVTEEQAESAEERDDEDLEVDLDG